MESSKQEAEVQAGKMDERQVREVKAGRGPARLGKREEAIQEREDQGNTTESQGKSAEQEAEEQVKKMDKRQAREMRWGKDRPRQVERELAVREERHQEEILEEEAQQQETSQNPALENLTYQRPQTLEEETLGPHEGDGQGDDTYSLEIERALHHQPP